jgi:hypothetical protein
MPHNLDVLFGNLRRPKSDPARPEGFDIWEKMTPATFQILQSKNGDVVLKNWLQVEPHTTIVRSVVCQIAILWAVTETGMIVYALEEAIDPKSFNLPTVVAPFLRTPVKQKTRERLGHPSLVDCGPARISGEIIYEKNTDGNFGWQLNNSSGRYGYGPDRTEEHLQNVKKEFENYGIFNLELAFS